ncbi:MAG TPA: hypothetical protein VGI92_05665 [Gemmatimonadales bacterium]|jgi:photosystem II stability/assembly factor-like uncharacterized protein
MTTRPPLPIRLSRIGIALSIALAAAGSLAAQTVSGLVWRNIGPLRAGRVSAVSGAVGEPGVFYAGFPTGGLWKTTSAGSMWEPIFDSITSVSSVGAVEVAPSDAGIVYVGTGDFRSGGNIDEGDGVYKSTDAGRTWRHIGLDSTKQIPNILVDPRDPNLVLVAAQGDLRTRGGQRGIYRSTDGGSTWTRVLYVDDITGVQKLAWAADNPDVVFASTNRHFNTPFVPGRPQVAPGAVTASLYKSTDRGVTWHEVTGGNLPRLVGRASIAVAMHTNSQRVFLIGNFGLWRSDDGGTTWRQMDAADRRVGNGQGGYNCGVYVSSSNPDVVITINTAAYISTDGGNTFTGFKGAPGGDDPQQLWIDPSNGQRMLMGLDQGAVATLDGGHTWSLWYNQSTEQVYHISADSSFPTWVYASQQDAGAVRTRVRGNYGAITPMDWSPVGTWEWGTVVADPRDPNVVYGSGSGILKVTWPSEQIINVSPALDPASSLRTTQSQPLIWAPWDSHTLLAGFQNVMATSDGGMHWHAMSPDLGYPRGVTPLPDSMFNRPPAPGAAPLPRRGAIEALAASTAKRGVIWAGLNTGLIKVTKDEGRTWQDASIPDLPDSNLSDISGIEASHHDPAEAWAAVDAHGTGNYMPMFYRTRDYGQTWTKIVTGLPTDLPSGSFARFIREDTKRAGLLFAGTESGMWVSFDDGEHWQSLQLNLPNTSYRDGFVIGNDLVVGTYGRGIFVLDDISPLRQLTPEIAAEPVHLFAPGGAVRVHRNVNQDTPFQPEVPHALNPPEGVGIYYSLAARPQGPVTIDITDAAGNPVRHLSSVAPAPADEAARPPEPSYWIAPPYALPASSGINRGRWDLRYDPPPALAHSFEINANPGLTPTSPEGPLAAPGTYTIRLTVDGQSYTSSVTVTNDPRIRVTSAALAAQNAMQLRAWHGLQAAWEGVQQSTALRSAVEPDTAAGVAAEVSSAAKALLARIDSVAGPAPRAPGAFNPFRRFGAGRQNFRSLDGAFTQQLNAQDLADQAPTEGTLANSETSCKQLATDVSGWNAIRGHDLAALNQLLGAHQMTSVTMTGSDLAAPSCGAPAVAQGSGRAAPHGRAHS